MNRNVLLCFLSTVFNNVGFSIWGNTLGPPCSGALRRQTSPEHAQGAPLNPGFQTVFFAGFPRVRSTHPYKCHTYGHNISVELQLCWQWD